MDLEVDLDALLEVFGEPNGQLSHPDRGDYWFDYLRSDGVSIRLIFGLIDRRVAVGTGYGGTASTSVKLQNCDRVRVLEPERRTIEIVSCEPPLRCFLSLDGETLMTVEAPDGIS